MTRDGMEFDRIAFKYSQKISIFVNTLADERAYNTNTSQSFGNICGAVCIRRGPIHKEESLTEVVSECCFAVV